MPTFMMSLNWTDQGIRGIKDAPKRVQAGRELAKKVGVEIKQLYLTAGGSDIVLGGAEGDLINAGAGDNIVLVATVSSHREAAFAAAEFLMDYLKTRAPFWKKEERAAGADRRAATASMVFCMAWASWSRASIGGQGRGLLRETRQATPRANRRFLRAPVWRITAARCGIVRASKFDHVS